MSSWAKSFRGPYGKCIGTAPNLKPPNSPLLTQVTSKAAPLRLRESRKSDPPREALYSTERRAMMAFLLAERSLLHGPRSAVLASSRLPAPQLLSPPPALVSREIGRA